LEKRSLGGRRKLGWDRRLTQGPAFNRAKLCVVALLVLTLSGCFGLASPEMRRYGTASLSGAVKIVTPSHDGRDDADKGEPAVLALSLRRDEAPSAILPAAATGFGPSYEYLVALRRRSGRAEAEEVAGRLGLFYEKEAVEGVHVLRDPLRREAASVIRLLEASAGVVWAEENGWVAPLGPAPDLEALGQWALAAIRAPEAWQIADASGVVVAVVDTGIDFAHPNLDDQSLWLTGWDAESGTDYGYGAFRREQADGHGTAVAGIIGAVPKSGTGFRGVAPGVRLLPVRVIFKGAGEDDVIAGIKEAAKRGAQVINLSLQVVTQSRPPRACSPAMSQALDEVLAAGIVVVAAAGNTRGDLACPASHPGVIAVGAVDRDGKVAAYSARGSDLDLVAPGGDANGVRVLRQGGGYGYEIGTSFAAPHVAGVVALMLGKGFPQDPESVRALLHMTAVQLHDAPGLHDERTGYGLLDALGAVAADIPEILLVKKEPGRLVVEVRSQAGTGGRFYIPSVPEGTWSVVGWIDVDGDGRVSPGDYYGEHGPVASRAMQNLVNVDVILRPYEGSPLELVTRS